MPKMPSRFDVALSKVTAAADEAHYEQQPRHAGLHPEVMAVIDMFDTTAERCALVMAFMDTWDMAQQRAIIAADLGAMQVAA